MNKPLKIALSVVAIIISVAFLIFLILFFIGWYLSGDMQNDPQFQQTLQGVEKSNPGVVSQSSVDITLIPEYGGFQKTPEQKKADDDFIVAVMKGAESKRFASDELIGAGNTSFQQGDLETAMRRYNQAWLLDNTNPEVYKGFGNILKERGYEEEANKMFDKASGLSL